MSFEKPAVVEWAMHLLWLSLGLGGIITFLSVPSEREPGYVLEVIIVNSIVVALLIFLYSKISAGRNWARITFAIFTILGLWWFVIELASVFEQSNLLGVLNTMMMIMDLAAAIMIYTPSANIWFKKCKSH